jgi:branched-chain amino acid transport system substrate-binding protein
MHGLPSRFLAIVGLMVAAAATLPSGAALPAAAVAGAVGQQRPPQEIAIGALLSLTGNGATLGMTSQAALTLAQQDINAELGNAGSSLRVRVVVEDTAFSPTIALQKTQELTGQGIKVVIGPQSSAEVAAVKPWIDSHGMVAISQGSTASSLSIPDDGILRFVPDDTHEIEALTALLLHDGVRTVVPLWRDDAGNRGLHDSLVRLFAAAGGSVLEGASYAPDASDYAPQLQVVRSAVEEAQQQGEAGDVAVYLASFNEAAELFHAAQHDPVLSAVRWYGADGVAQSAALLSDADAAAFAERVGFPCPNLGLDADAQPVWQPLADRIEAMTGVAPDASGLAAYDAAWVAALSYLETGPAADGALLLQTIPSAAGRYFGATGRTTLNAAGDRASGDYDFWAVRSNGGTPAWTAIGSYQVSPGSAGRVVLDTNETNGH